MDDNGKLIEIQCSAEKEPFSKEQFENMYSMAAKGIGKIVKIQKSALDEQKIPRERFGVGYSQFWKN